MSTHEEMLKQVNGVKVAGFETGTGAFFFATLMVIILWFIMNVYFLSVCERWVEITLEMHDERLGTDIREHL